MVKPKWLLPFFIITLLGISPTSFSEDDVEDSWWEKSKAAANETRKSASEAAAKSVSTIVTAPERAIDAGCLDNIRMMKADLTLIDPSFALVGQIVDRMMTDLLSQACQSITDNVNSATDKWAGGFSDDYGLIDANVGHGATVKNWKEQKKNCLEYADDARDCNDLFKARLDNNEAAQKLGTKTLGNFISDKDMPSPTDRKLKMSDPIDVRDLGEKDSVNSINKALEFQSLWGTKREREEEVAP